MTDNLQLAVNAAMNEAAIARARMGLLNIGMGLDAKRASAWCEYGFKENIEFSDLYNLYRRGGIAHGAVNKLVQNCWKTNPEIIEGDEQDDSRKETPWERSNKAIFNNRFWRSFTEADRRRLVGRYAGILLHIGDGKKWDQPAVTGKTLKKITVAWAGSLTVAEWETDEKSENFGNPKVWQYKEALPNGGSQNRMVNPDRVFILGDYSTDAIGFLEPAYNAFVSLEKVEGGSGESFLKNAARQLNINFDREIDFGNLASMYGVSVDELQSKYDEAAKELNRGNDTLLTTQGATVTPLVSAVSDPSPTYNVNLQTAAAALDIPTKILVGMQTGERASTEDQKYFNARCQSRRGDLSLEIEDLCDKLIKLGVIKGISMKTVVWDDLNEQTAAEKLESAVKMSQINSASISTGEAVFTVDEIRVAGGYEPDGAEPLGEVDDGEKTKTGDNTEEQE